MRAFRNIQHHSGSSVCKHAQGFDLVTACNGFTLAGKHWSCVPASGLQGVKN